MAMLCEKPLSDLETRVVPRVEGFHCTLNLICLHKRPNLGDGQVSLCGFAQYCDGFTEQEVRSGAHCKVHKVQLTRHTSRQTQS